MPITETETSSETETENAGEALARALAPGAVVLLYGDLGAGKTAFVRGLARGTGADPDEVTSPTFTIVQEYTPKKPAHSQSPASPFYDSEKMASVSVSSARPTLYHVDLYRLEPAEVDDLGLEDLVSGDGIVAIEWAERWKGRPSDVVEVRLEDAGEERRRLTIYLPSSAS